VLILCGFRIFPLTPRYGVQFYVMLSQPKRTLRENNARKDSLHQGA
jgi:hypothetical protein